MITEEEYRKALAIIKEARVITKQYTKEREEARIAIRDGGNLSFEEKHPIAKEGDYIEITSVHTPGYPKHLKIGVRLKAIRTIVSGGIRCRCYLSNARIYYVIKCDHYDWKIVSKAAE